LNEFEFLLELEAEQAQHSAAKSSRDLIQQVI
jgi:hypothetical protein